MALQATRRINFDMDELERPSHHRAQPVLLDTEHDKQVTRQESFPAIPLAALLRLFQAL